MTATAKKAPNPRKSRAKFTVQEVAQAVEQTISDELVDALRSVAEKCNTHGYQGEGGEITEAIRLRTVTATLRHDNRVAEVDRVLAALAAKRS